MNQNIDQPINPKPIKQMVKQSFHPSVKQFIKQTEVDDDDHHHRDRDYDDEDLGAFGGHLWASVGHLGTSWGPLGGRLGAI